MRAKKWFPPLADIFVWIHGIITSSSRKYHCAMTKGDIHVPAVWYTFNTATIRTSSSWLIFINQLHNFDLGIGNKTSRFANRQSCAISLLPQSEILVRYQAPCSIYPREMNSDAHSWNTTKENIRAPDISCLQPIQLTEKPPRV